MLVFGLSMVAVTILLYGIGLITFRRPNPPQWTEGLLGELYALLLVALPLFGAAVSIRYGLDPSSLADDTAPIAASLALLVGTVLVWRLLGVRRKLAAYAAYESASAGAAASAVPTAAMPANDDAKPVSPGRPGGTRSARRRAA